MKRYRPRTTGEAADLFKRGTALWHVRSQRPTSLADVEARRELEEVDRKLHKLLRLPWLRYNLSILDPALDEEKPSYLESSRLVLSDHWDQAVKIRRALLKETAGR